MAPRVVLDPNCLISALIFPHGKTAGLRHLWQGGASSRLFAVKRSRSSCGSSPIPSPAFPGGRRGVACGIPALGGKCPLAAPCDRVPELRDPDDAVFLHLAKAPGADYLVSGDGHLLEARAFFTAVPLLSPAEFLTHLGDPD